MKKHTLLLLLVTLVFSCKQKCSEIPTEDETCASKEASVEVTEEARPDEPDEPDPEQRLDYVPETYNPDSRRDNDYDYIPQSTGNDYSPQSTQ